MYLELEQRTYAHACRNMQVTGCADDVESDSYDHQQQCPFRKADAASNPPAPPKENHPTTSSFEDLENKSEGEFIVHFGDCFT